MRSTSGSTEGQQVPTRLPEPTRVDSAQRCGFTSPHEPPPRRLEPLEIPGTLGRMAHWLFNLSDGDREQATALLRAKMWGVGRHEGHSDAVAPGDLALVYLPAPEREFIGRAELATAVHDW